jgi:hypothetical protein
MVEEIRIEIGNGGSILGLALVGGEPAPNTQLIIQHLDEAGGSARSEVETDDEGYFELGGVLDGERTIRGILKTSEHGELWSNVARVLIEEGGLAWVRLVFMAGAATIEGQVLVNGEPAADQDFGVNLYSPDGTEARALITSQTDAEGAFQIEGIEEGPVSLHAYVTIGGAPIYGDPVVIDARADTTTEIDLEFERGEAVIEGRITRGGEPQRYGRIIIAGQVTDLDAGGSYRVDGVSIDRSGFSPALYAGTGKIYTSRTFPYTPTASGPNEIDFEFPSGTAAINGYVADDSGQPVAARVVVVYHDQTGSEWFHAANAQDDGYYAFDRLPANPAVIMLYLPGQQTVPATVDPLDLLEGAMIEHDFVVPSQDPP